jgi:hypothetical protein
MAAEYRELADLPNDLVPVSDSALIRGVAAAAYARVGDALFA